MSLAPSTASASPPASAPGEDAPVRPTGAFDRTRGDDGQALALCRASIAHHSKSFALASKVLPPASRDSAAVLYAWCRYADDAVDLVPANQQPAALQRLRDELDRVYGQEDLTDPVLGSFQRVVRHYRIPREYPQELVEGMAMDVVGTSYRTTDTLLLYCYRVASVVGLMMSHIMGLNDDKALRQAAHMGIGMQLTNICRDVLEDWGMGRLYLPDDLLDRVGLGDLRAQLGTPLSPGVREPLARAVELLLADADRYYESGDRGVPALPWRCAFAVRAARRVYSAIGGRLRRRGCDVFAGRAYVPTWRKLALVASAGLRALVELPVRGWRRAFGRPQPAIPNTQLRFPNDVLPV